MLTWVDLETTGLEPHPGQILELGVVITNDQLIEIDRRSWVVSPLGVPMSPSTPDRRTWAMSQYVLDMHTQSGLIEECLTIGRPLCEVEEEARTWISDTHAGSLALMARSSIHFDRSWIKVHMPDLDEVFGYRMIDVSSIKELVARWWPGREYKVEGEKPHRAMLDIDHSIRELRYYAAEFMGRALM